MGKYCRNCGAELREGQQVCLNCGSLVEDSRPQTGVTNTGNAGWGVLGFFIPLAGLILYIVWKDTSPRNASVAGKGALIGFIVSIVAGIIYGIILGVIMGSASAEYYSIISSSVSDGLSLLAQI